MPQRLIVFKSDQMPPAEWSPGATVSLYGRWWTVGQQWFDEQTRRWNCEADEASPIPLALPSFDKTDDPGWDIGDLVTDPNGDPVRIVERKSVSLSRVGYWATRKPPDSSAVEALIE